MVHRTSGLQARAQIGLCACLGKVRRTATDRRQLSERRGSALQAKQRITIEEGGASGNNSKVFSKQGSLPRRKNRYDNWRQAALGVSVCSHRHQSKQVAQHTLLQRMIRAHACAEDGISACMCPMQDLSHAGSFPCGIPVGSHAGSLPVPCRIHPCKTPSGSMQDPCRFHADPSRFPACMLECPRSRATHGSAYR